jgi:hypothetical protein
MKLNLKELIGFYDDPNRDKKNNKHVSAITGVIGEDLCTAVFVHFLTKKSDQVVEVLIGSDKDPLTPTQGGRRGKRLDRWIHVKSAKKEMLYQCEIKNWAASAIGGERLPINCTKEELNYCIIHHWDRQLTQYFRDTDQPNAVTKVLLGMQNLKQYAQVKVEPLIIYWMPILNPSIKSTEPYFTVSLKELRIPSAFPRTDFSRLNFFSVSLYLRQLLEEGKKSLDLEMPNAEQRMKILSDILKV